MGVLEVLFRAVQFLHILAERLGLGRARPKEPGSAVSRPWLNSLPTGFETGPYLAAADAILQGRYSIFALKDANIGFPPDWNCDPKSGTRAPMEFGKSLNYRDNRIVGNIKYLWEPNRHLEFVTLAEAWHLSRDLKFAVGCMTMLDSWFKQCPYPLGPNWSSSLELGIRLVNWSFGWHLLGGESSPLFATKDGMQFRRRWLDSIYLHCHFIAGHPSKYSSANNHLLGEQLGLFIAAMTWPLWPESVRWQAESRQVFQQEVLLQNSEDGVNREQAIWYQHEVIDMMLIAGLVGRRNGVHFDLDFWTRLESMIEFVASIMDVSGNVPAFGDSDDALMVRFDPRPNFHAYRSQLATGAVLFGRSAFKANAGGFDDKTRWLLGDDAEQQFADIAMDNDARPLRRAFPQGGYYVLGSDFDTEDEIRIVADAGPLGYLSIAAHGHADALSFTLSASGREFLIDPGTFAYHTEREWRDYFRGTAAHNTVRIDAQDQSLSGGSFLWVKHARVFLESFEVHKECQVLTSSHDGYLRMKWPAIHRRRLRFDKSAKSVEVEDAVLSNGKHQVEMHWHFSECCNVEMHEDHAFIKNCDTTVKVHWPVGSTARLVRGSHAPALAWRSRRFDTRQPCSTIVICQQINGDWFGRTDFKILLPN